MADTPLTMMGRLKAETAELHSRAESRPLQKRLVKGELPREHYTAWLAQMYLVHRVLEERIRGCADLHPAFGAVVQSRYWRAGNLEADLAHLGAEASASEPLPATSRLIENIETTAARTPVALLGMLYVREGATNGSKFIAAALRRAYGLESAGLSYLDPYGDRQKETWGEFKRDMDSTSFSEPESLAIIEAAKTIFIGVSEISDELAQPLAV
jgi:heme oxygenase